MTEINEWKKIPIFSIIFWAVKAILKCVKKKTLELTLQPKKIVAVSDALISSAVKYHKKSNMINCSYSKESLWCIYRSHM